MDEIFYLVSEGGGGFIYSDVFYHMPITTRKEFVKKLDDKIAKRNAILKSGPESDENSITMENMINRSKLEEFKQKLS